QVFNALVGHALQYARNGVVEASLRASVDKDVVRLDGRVRDNGHVVDQDKLDRIFEPFAHVEGQASGDAGLSLSICRQIREAMGGSIRAETNAGKGATFAFELKLARAWLDRADAETNVSELTELQLQAQPHILIVDDNATNRVVAQALCEMF